MGFESMDGQPAVTQNNELHVRISDTNMWFQPTTKNAHRSIDAHIHPYKRYTQYEYQTKLIVITITFYDVEDEITILLL